MVIQSDMSDNNKNTASPRLRQKRSGKVIGLKIEMSRPEDEPQVLARQLADAMQTEINAASDAIAYRAQAQRERQKAKELINTLIQLQEYNRVKKEKLKVDPNWESKPPWEGGPSRMEPMAGYNEDDIKAQKVTCIQNAQELDSQANEFDSIVKEQKALQTEIQRKLRGK